MQFAALGPVGAIERDEPVHLGGPRHHAVLGVLIAQVGRAVPIDVIVTEIWGDDAGERAIASLYTHISNLRHVLGKHRIAGESGGYRLALAEGDEVDVALFETGLAEARQQSGVDPAGAVEALEAALASWRGRPYEGLEDVPMLAAEITRLSELRATAQIDRFEALLRMGDLPLVADLEELCASRPLDERPWNLLMRTLYRHGRHAEALSTYTKVRTLFGEEMGIEPSPALSRLEEQILLHDPVLSGVPMGRPASLPVYLTSFVGRDEEMQRLADSLDEHRLVTVLGPGGVGKTRLVVESVTRLRGRFPDGVWFVDLAGVTDPSLVAAAIAERVGATGGTGDAIDALGQLLRGGPSLLVLDNCEHVVDGLRNAAGSLLRSVPGLVILATSRCPLEIAGEQRFLIDGLSIDAAGDTPGDAVVLFSERAAAAGSRVDLPASAGDAVTAVCRKLDGMPLALELAAAQSDALSPTEIAGLLTHRFALLVDDRQSRSIHRSLEATVGWSYGLLDADRRRAFETLSVFEGPFTVEHAAVILGRNPDDTLSVIEALVSASLLSVEPHDGRATTYRLLEVLRSYATDRLEESGRMEEAVQRHDRHFTDVCADLTPDLLVSGRWKALARIAGVVPELTAAWGRMEKIDPGSVMPIAWALGSHWLVKGGIVEGEQRIGDVLDATVGRTVPLKMRVLLVGALLAERRGHRERARAWADEALEIAEGTGDGSALIVALNFVGRLRIEQGDHPGAVALLQRSMGLLGRSPRAGEPPGLTDGRAWALVTLAEARRWSGDTASDVRDHLYGVRRHFRDIGDVEGELRADRVLVTMSEIPRDERLRLANEMMNLARHESAEGEMQVVATRALAGVMWEMGDGARATVLNRAAIRSAMVLGSLIDLGSVLLQAAMFAGWTDGGDRAAKLAGAGHHLCGMRSGPFRQPGLEGALEQVRSEMGADRFDELYRIGAAMEMDELAAFALG